MDRRPPERTPEVTADMTYTIRFLDVNVKSLVRPAVGVDNTSEQQVSLEPE
jgi:hypothetical protein